MNRLSFPPLLLCAVALLAAAVTAAGEGRVFVRSRYLMGTAVEIKARGADAAETQGAINAAFDEIARLEALMTTWSADSDVSRVNAMAGRAPVRVAPEVIEVVEHALGVSRLTGGAFDITIEPLVQLWGIDGDGKAKVPAKKEIDAALGRVGYRHVHVDRGEGTIFLDEAGVRIGLGGVAKGYAAERARGVLKARGVRSAIVNAGGDMAMLGKDGDRPWRVDIRDPREPGGTMGWLQLENRTVHTSGDYERFRVIKGKRYHHILSPLTGYPARRSQAVTIVSRDGALGDALSTGVLVLGPEEGIKLIESLDGVAVLVVDNGGKLHMSGAMRKRFHPAPLPERRRESVAPSLS
ncbi:MAG: FAD:protein FMN transferase [Deltaproteobacteria bacterium]|nr:FAD:protein FMN transferase [Deltaproteobacteria bacterium]